MHDLTQQLDRRRQELGISRDALARQINMPRTTLVRILAGQDANPTLANVRAVAEALGGELCFRPVADSEALREQRAEAKAREIARMVQATMGLEAQGMDRKTFEKLVRENKRILLGGSDRRLWE